MEYLSFKDLKNALKTVELENRLELVQVSNTSNIGYECKISLNPDGL